MSDPLLPRLAEIVGDKNILTEAGAAESYLTEERGLYRGKAVAVVRPASVEEVASVVALCAEAKVPVVPQGGNTGLVGGGVPDETGRAVVVSLNRMTSVREVDIDTGTMTVDAGVTLQAAQEKAAEHDRLFPLSLASEGSCTVGGNIATNAGGTAVVAYGNMRDLVLGLEVVLADGRIWNGLRKLKKDNTGYDMKQLFIGAEGTLGIITGAVLKLAPANRSVETAFIGLNSPEQALALFRRAQATAGSALIACELMPRIGIDFVLAHGSGVRDPLSGSHAWYVLLELASPAEQSLRETMEAILEGAIEAGDIEDAALSETLDQRAVFWKLRHLLSEVQKHEGGSIKHDVSVPIGQMPAFVGDATAAAEGVVPGCRPVPFGHMGDGNIHFNVSQPVGDDKQAYLARWGEMNEAVHAVVTRYSGSISAEHGIGRLKRGLLAEIKAPVELDMMRRVKSALDPNGVFNPGVVI
ncbi:D-2-hydroxyacid dehydrogenase [Agaricicola taiwanensis]|uniref:D-2-hydroxyacid dehydrogenase n=1 Tax=Agaricicola taiwanensis TaxID=591372 RepID=A0A8J2VPE0_9RHOB|nr:FAD-binding oxidoreductase [Agaricicola taiwanensis]GGE35713.1 D-2-hydroxyacid dehydrogenase [Agaricicola taiwanensis]